MAVYPLPIYVTKRHVTTVGILIIGIHRQLHKAYGDQYIKGVYINMQSPGL